MKEIIEMRLGGNASGKVKPNISWLDSGVAGSGATKSKPKPKSVVKPKPKSAVKPKPKPKSTIAKKKGGKVNKQAEDKSVNTALTATVNSALAIPAAYKTYKALKNAPAATKAFYNKYFKDNANLNTDADNAAAYANRIPNSGIANATEAQLNRLPWRMGQTTPSQPINNSVYEDVVDTAPRMVNPTIAFKPPVSLARPSIPASSSANAAESTGADVAEDTGADIAEDVGFDLLALGKKRKGAKKATAKKPKAKPAMAKKPKAKKITVKEAGAKKSKVKPKPKATKPKATKPKATKPKATKKKAVSKN